MNAITRWWMEAGLMVIVALCFLFAGCRDVKSVWSAESASPDGRWIAASRVDENGGPGNDGLDAVVFLRDRNASNAPIEVLAFSLGDVPSARYGELGLSMKWRSPSRLDVTYNAQVGTLYFQVVKTSGIDISTTAASGAPTTAFQ